MQCRLWRVCFGDLVDQVLNARKPNHAQERDGTIIMKKHHPKFTTLLLLSGLFAFYSSPIFGQSVLFDFDNAPLYSPLPIDLTVGGITAHFSASPTYYNYSIQRADVLGFTPVGFAGYCIYPSQVYLCDLLISFDHALADISIMYAPRLIVHDANDGLLGSYLCWHEYLQHSRAGYMADRNTVLQFDASI